MIKKIAVLGAGAGGQATAVEMSLRGYMVNLFELPQFKENIKPIEKYGGITVFGDIQGFTKIHAVTTDIKKAVEGVDLVIIVVQSLGHRALAENCLPYLEDGQIVSYIGEPGGALEFANVMQEKKIEKDIIIGEANTLPYRARLVSSATVSVVLKKGGFLAAAFPAKNNSVLLKALKELWPKIVPATNVFETILLNFNAIDHIPPALMNVGHLETYGIMRYWGDGATLGVARCIEALSNETVAIRKALGFKNLTPYKDWLVEQGFLDSPKSTTYEAIHSSGLAKSVKECRPGLLKEDRYITESLPYGLRLIASIGDIVGVETPTIDAFINIASTVNEIDYWKEGRSCEKLGIAKGLSVKELTRFLYTGKPLEDLSA